MFTGFDDKKFDLLLRLCNSRMTEIAMLRSFTVEDIAIMSITIGQARKLFESNGAPITRLREVDSQLALATSSVDDHEMYERWSRALMLMENKRR